jgi:hypothetical protein
MQSSPLAEFAANFGKPFWGKFSVEQGRRTESVLGIDPTEPGCITNLSGTFVVAVDAGNANLRWNCEATSCESLPLVTCVSWLAATADTMDKILRNHFAPQRATCGRWCSSM